MTPEQLKTLRKQAKATQAECAAMISVPTRRFQRWEAGTPCIPYSDFNLLCVLLRTKNRITQDQARALMCPFVFDINFLSNQGKHLVNTSFITSNCRVYLYNSIMP